MKSVIQTNITAYPLRSRGKVRDIYDLDAESLLIVTTDRMSAFDVIMSEPIPYKGVILNQITLFWMDKFKDIVPNHLIESDVANFPANLAPWQDELEGRSVIVRKAQPLPIECIVRGYLTGSGLKDYQATGEVCGHKLPPNLVEASQIEPAIFTPSTKAELGTHDENISLAQAATLLGQKRAAQVEALAIKLYTTGRDYSWQKGIIVADTKFEFGLINDELILIDEVLTPDSSRFWPKADYAKGHGQPSFDKQYLRDWLKTQTWNKQPPAPTLPPEVIKLTQQKYCEAYHILTGRDLPLPSTL